MKLFKIILSWILVIFWVICIFMMSNMNSDVSSNVSNGLIEKTITTTYEVTSKIGITDMPSEDKISDMVLIFDLPIRKLAHFFEYFILSMLLFNALVVTGIKKNLFAIIITICFTYACSDELHQLFINGRAGRLYDIVIDTFGSLMGTLLLSKIYKK